VLAQDRLGAPLRQAALKFILAANAGELGRRDRLQIRAEQAHLPYGYTGAEKRFDQACPVDDIQRCRLQCSPSRLVVWLEPTFDHAWPHAMTQQLARGKQAGRTCSYDHDS
jgi:hypothetical protein